MRELAEMIVRALEKRNIISVADHDVYIYGFDAALYTFFSTVGLLLIGCLLGRGIETLIIVALFYINQTLGGGFHATTHCNCFITMAVGLLVCLATFLLPFSHWAYCVLGVVGLALMMKYPLVLHKNKEYLLSKQARLCKRSRVTLLVEGILLIAVGIWGSHAFIQAYCIALAACAVSWLVAVFQKEKREIRNRC